MPATFPIADAPASRALGGALRRVGYTEDAVVELLGDEAYTTGREDRPLHERRLDGSALATVVRLLFLELPVSRRAAVGALGRRAVDALAATALVDVGDELVPRARIVPLGDLLLASDGYTRGIDDPAEYVATYSPTARRCDALTPRPRVRRALDVGTGSGVQAVLAARHARHVVATDVNPRALAYTALNAALNAFDNVECRRGSLFEPAGDDAFDLITCNAPYVVSPETKWIYRDSGLELDEVSERVVRGAAERLNDGGYATLLCSWVERDPDQPHARPLAWLDGNGCDAWVLWFESADPLDHAAGWNSDLAGEAGYASTLDEWAAYLERSGVSAVHEGAVLLHRRSGRAHTVRLDEVDPDDIEPADAQIRRAFAARARLAELRRGADLAGAVLAPVPALRVEHELAPRAKLRARVRLDEGTFPEVDAPPDVADLFVALDGRPLRELVPRTVPERRVVTLARELLELGALRFE